MTLPGERGERTAAMLEMVIDSIRVSLMNYQRVVILKERDADRYLPIWIGSPEADAIAVKLQDVSVPRPLTHDLLGSVIHELGADVDHVIVSDLSNDTFFAKLVMNMTGGDMKEVDCRPSDAIAIAVRGGQMVVGKDGSESWFASVQDAQKFLEEQGIAPDAKGHEIRSKVPIFVVEGVLEKAGVMMDHETGKPVEESPLPKSERVGGEAITAVTDEEMERMSAFSDFLQDLPGLEEIGGTSNS
jgi:bifunctional DNase/RNase